MIRHLKILLLVMAIFGLMAGTAFAGTTFVNAGAAGQNFTVSLEATGTARNVTVVGLGALNTNVTAALGYTPGTALVAGNLLSVTFTNAAFTGVALNLCAMNAGGDVLVSNATPTAGSAAANFQLNAGATLNLATPGATNGIYITSGVCGVAAINMPVQISSGSSARTATVVMGGLTSGGISIDASTAKTLATVRSEYAAASNSTNHTIDYLGTPGNGTKLISGGGAPNVTADSLTSGANNSVNVTLTVNNYDTNGAGAGANAGLTVGAVVSLTDSANWQGISKVYLVPNLTACTIGANSVANTAPANTVALTIPSTGGANSFTGLFARGFGLCVEADGTSALKTRTIQSSVDVGVSGTGANDPIASAYADTQVWGINAYQAVIPWMVNSSVVPTYCLINNADTARTASVILDVISSESAVVLTNATLGSIASKTSNMATFTTDSASLAGGTAVSLSTLGADKRYSPRLTVTTNPNNVSMTCIQTDPVSGAKRAVPVLSSAGAAWKQ